MGTYRAELGDLRRSLNTEVETLRSEFQELRASLRQQLEVTSKLASQEGTKTANSGVTDTKWEATALVLNSVHTQPNLVFYWMPLQGCISASNDMPSTVCCNLKHVGNADINSAQTNYQQYRNCSDKPAPGLYACFRNSTFPVNNCFASSIGPYKVRQYGMHNHIMFESRISCSHLRTEMWYKGFGYIAAVQ